MSTKRRPDTDLNHDNWADEEEPEEVGEFMKADEAELKSRVIVKAKRRIRATDTTDGGTETPRANVFSGFSAFASNKPAFNFGNFSAKVAEGTSVLPASASQFAFTVPSTTITATSSTEPEKSAQFCSKLKELNKAVIDCVKGHIDSGKLCILTPIFNDYIKYAKELEDEEQKKPAIETTKSTPTPTFSFSNTNNNNKNSEPNSLSTAPTISSMNPSPFSFGKPSVGFGSTSSPGTGFFANVKPPEPKPDTSSATTSEVNTDADADAEDAPPKVEFTPVVESESMYSKRCKVFVKVDKEYNSRGSGTLYLKNIAENNKVQLIVRADTNLGNILLNVLLTEGLPVQKLGKNNVMIMCIPTPESEPKATPVLVRVKDEAEAEELLAEIKKHLK